MTKRTFRPSFRWMTVLLAVAIYVMPISGLAQTQIKLHSNKYKLQDDVRVGQEAAAQAERQFPILRDNYTTDYVEAVGQRLVDAIPREFQHPEFRYTFKVVNARDINAFALPGGPMYVNRGMIEAARNEGEMAGVMAHEISHVALRHGTAQATKAQKYSVLAGIGAIAGSILGGPAVGQVAAQSVGVYFLKFSREYEKEADLLGARIMADAGYDPMDLANMFRTIEQQGGGSGGPQFLSSHPNPGNRYNAIQQEARLLNVSRNPIKVTREFSQTQARLRGMGRARSLSELSQSNQGSQGNSDGGYSETGYGGGGYVNRVPAPSSRYRTFNAGKLSLNVPENWRQLTGDSSITFAPEGAYGTEGITHGSIVGAEQARYSQLQSATDAYLQSLLGQQSNSYLRRQSGYQRATISGREALGATLSGRSPITGRTETVTVYTTLLRNGALFYFITVAPQADSYAYNRACQGMLNSIRLSD